MNKRGVIGIIIFFAILFIILAIGFIAAVFMSAVDFASDTITPVMEDLGVVGEANMSEIAEYTFTQTDRVIQALPWVLALGYGLALVFSIVFVVGFSYNPHPVFIGFYVALMLLLVFGAMFMANMYQDIYEGDSEIATRLQEQTMLSYMILYSPFILIVIAAIAGIFLFTRSYGDTGGFV